MPANSKGAGRVPRVQGYYTAGTPVKKLAVWLPRTSATLPAPFDLFGQMH